MSNPNPPPNSSPDFIAGWNARAVADGTAPPAPPPPANVVNVPVGSDLTPILNAAKVGFTYNLAAGEYTVSALATVITDHLKLIGAGSGKTTARIIGKHTGIELRGASPEISGIHFDSAFPLATAGPAKVGFNALHIICVGPNIHDCTCSNVDDFALIEPPSINVAITNCSGDATIRGDFIFSSHDDGLNLTNVTVVSSKQEHGIRFSPTTTNQGTANVVISGCTLSNTDGKESLAIRGAKGPIAIKNCTFGAWVRLGQVAPSGTTPPAFSVGPTTITGCHFTNQSYLALCQGTTTDVSGNAFDGYAHVVGVAVQGPKAIAKIENNVRTAMPGQAYTSAFVQQFTTTAGDVIETGTVEKK